MPLTFPKLFLRSEKGSRLTHPELDGNFTRIRDFCKALASLFGAALNPDGSLNSDTVGTDQLKDRSVTQRKLDPAYAFVAKDSGGVNTFVVSFIPAITAYANGQTYRVKANFNNTGPSTLKVDSLPAVAIKKRGSTNLESGDISAGGVFDVTYYDGYFHLSSSNVVSTGGGSGSGVDSGINFTGVNKYESAQVPIPPLADVPAVEATGVLTSDNTNPANGATVTIDAKVYTFRTALTPTEGEVLIGATADDTLLNLINAINHTGTPGTDYSCAAAHTTVDAEPAVASHKMTVHAITAGVAGNDIAIAESSSHLHWDGTSLDDGEDAVEVVSSFNHGFGALPSDINILLICIESDGDFGSGDTINALDITDLGGLPAFTIIANTTSINVSRNVVAIYAGGNGGDLMDITTPKWKMLVTATRMVSESTSGFPDTNLTLMRPFAAFSYGNNLFMIHRSKYNSSTTYLERVTMGNNNVVTLDPPASNAVYNYPNVAIFARSSGDEHTAVWTSDNGVFTLPMEDPGSGWKPALLFNRKDAHKYKPVHIVESGSSITEVYCITNAVDAETIKAVKVKLLKSSSTANYGTAFDFTNASILDADGSSGNTEFRKWHPSGNSAQVVLIQYNPVKKRIYVMSNETGMIHIFQIQTAADFKTWWDLATAARYSDLKYIKTIMCSGPTPFNDDTEWERIAIDFDLTTGVEAAVCYVTRGGYDRPGSVIRTRWLE